MEYITLTLNNFLFNSGILGLYKILRHEEKEGCMQIEGNTITLSKDFIQDFSNGYFNTMLDTYEKDTRWFSLTNKMEWLKNANIETPEGIKLIEEIYKNAKAAIESNSYQAGYEVLKNKGETEDPYFWVEEAKKEKDISHKKQLTQNILEHIKKHRDTYCMKDIVYNKINLFWENVAFLNRSSNKKDMLQEYENCFVVPAKKFLQKAQKSDYSCVECGTSVSKGDIHSRGWLKEQGVDMNRKKSGFWNQLENDFICPICNLIYSCAPLGFSVIGQVGIFINNNEDMETLIRDNNMVEIKDFVEEKSYEKLYQKVLTNYISRGIQLGNEKMAKREPDNIQVIKKVRDQYQFNIISKDRLEIINNTIHNFERLMGKTVVGKDSKTIINVYNEVLNNFMENRNQYDLVEVILNKTKDASYVEDILQIQRYCIGGIDLKELEELEEELRESGQTLRRYYYSGLENSNKLETYIFQLINAARINNPNLFMEIVFRMYPSKQIPAADAFSRLVGDRSVFRQLADQYIIGLKSYKGKAEDQNKQEKEGVVENEE